MLLNYWRKIEYFMMKHEFEERLVEGEKFEVCIHCGFADSLDNPQTPLANMYCFKHPKNYNTRRRLKIIGEAQMGFEDIEPEDIKINDY